MVTRLLTVALALLVLRPDATAQKPERPLGPRAVGHLLETTQGLDGFSRTESSDLRRRLGAFAAGEQAVAPAAHPVRALTASERRTLRETITPSLDAALPLVHLERSQNGTVNWMVGKLAGPKGPGKRAPRAQVLEWAREDLQRLADVLKLDDPSAELLATSLRVDALGYAHARFEQVYRGVPVWSRDVVVHYDESGSLYAINGTYEPSPRDVATEPALRAEEAVMLTKRDLQRRGRWAPLSERTAAMLDLEDPAPRLVLYPSEERGMRLAYEIVLHANLLERFRYLIDAQSGEVLNRIADHCTLDHTAEVSPQGLASLEIASVASAPSAGFVDAQGQDLNGQTQSFRVHVDDQGTHWLFSDLDNVGTFSLPNLPENGGAVVVSAQNQDLKQDTQVAYITSQTNSWSDPTAVSAHANMHVTYNYFKGAFGRQAINDQNQSLISIVRVTQNGRGLDNAYWNSRHMIYGDGDQVFKPLAGGLDVAAHEMTHGVIQHTAGLVYQAQPGALNESFADVFGVMVDREDLLVGEDVMNGGHAALRDLLNPDNPQARSGDPAINGNYTQPAHMDQYRNLPNTEEADNGGVHINSGIPNRAAALLIQAIGHDKAQQIYYRALSSYLTRNSQFGDARRAVIQSAVDLYGDGSEAAAARQAFDAVGLGDNVPQSDPTTNDVPAVTGSRSIIAFTIADGSALQIPDGTIAFLDPFADNFLGVFTDPRAVARVGGQLSTTVDGTSIWFIDQQGRLAYIDLSGVDIQSADSFAQAPVVVGDGLYLEQPGDLWNVSVGPIGITEQGEIVELIALASAYEDDPFIYFTDLNDVVPIELAPETTQQGIDNNLIRYPDVMAWSPNPNQPKVAFDALQGVPLSAGNAPDYWSIFEIDFSVSQIYGLIPTQPAEINVGNITYSRTNPDIVAFNVIENGLWDVYLADFEQAQLVALELPSIVEGQTPLLPDGERPTFAPDDSFLAFGSTSRQSIVFYNTSSSELSEFPFEIVPFGPHWFVAKGDVSGVVSTGVENANPSIAGFSLEGAYPNPFTAGARVRIRVDAPSVVQAVVFDMLGRPVQRLSDGVLQSGEHELLIDGEGLPAGTYVVRVEAAGRVDSRTLVKLN